MLTTAVATMSERLLLTDTGGIALAFDDSLLNSAETLPSEVYTSLILLA
jgi:hypothetical protein